MEMIIEEALRLTPKLRTIAWKATMRNPLHGYDTEDLMQGFYLRIIEKGSKFDHSMGVKITTWLYHVFNNYVRDLMRKQRNCPIRFYKDIKKFKRRYRQKNKESMEVRTATYDLLNWLKEKDQEGWLIITLLLRHGGCKYHASLDANLEIREINRIITRVRNYEETKELFK